MKTEQKDNKKQKIALVITVVMSLLFIAFLFYRNSHDFEYREQKCVEEVADKIKQYYQETGKEPEEVIVEMYQEDCMREAGWLR